MQAAYHSKTIRNNTINYRTQCNIIQNSPNVKRNYLLSSMTWTVTNLEKCAAFTQIKGVVYFLLFETTENLNIPA